MESSVRIEVQCDREGGWSVVRNCVVDGYFSDVAAANDYASACARRAERAGLVVSLRLQGRGLFDEVA